MLGQSSPSLLFILIVVLLLVILLWFWWHNAWKAYAARNTARILGSNNPLKKIDWSGISAPDANGIRFTTGAYPLSSNAGSIGITTFGRDEDEMTEFIGEAQFYFEPIFEKIPFSPLSLLRGFSSMDQQQTSKPQAMTSGKIAMQVNTPVNNIQLEPNEDMLVEFDLQALEKSDQVQAIGFIIDPRVRQRQSKSFSAKVTAVYDTVSVSEGSVNASLKKGSDEIDSGSIGTGSSDVMSTNLYSKAQNFKMKVVGTSGSNVFRLSGTWNKE